MRIQAAAHREHLEEVLAAQKAQLEAQCKREMDEAIIKERDVFNREIAFSIARLQAIEAALEGKAWTSYLSEVVSTRELFQAAPSWTVKIAVRKSFGWLVSI